MATKKGPCYDLDLVKRLVADEKYFTTNKVRKILINHGYVVSDTVADVIQSIRPDDFYKCDELKNNPGVYADIYHHVKCNDEEWYVKYFLNDNGSPSVSIWSLKEDGYQY